MEVHVQELIDSIKKDGVQAAQAEAEKIVEAARKEAEQVISEAQQKAKRIISDAEAAQERREASGKAALEQSGRDLLLSVEKRLVTMIEVILSDKIGEAMKGKTLENMLLEVVKQDISQSGADIEIAEKLYNSLSKELLGELKKKLSKGAEIKPVKHIDAGFRITEKKGSGYVSFAPEDLAQMLSAFLSPELQKLIHESSKTS